MYRKMKAEVNESDVVTPMPHLECVDKLTKLPVIEMVVNQTSDIYEKVKGSSSVANWTLSTAEATVNKVVEQTAPMVKSLEHPIHVVDQTLCRGLASLEDKVPMVKDEPQEILTHAKDYVSSSLQPTMDRVSVVTNYGVETASHIKDYSWNKANDILNTKWGAIVLSGFDMTANLAHKCLDYYLPAADTDAPAPVATDGAIVEVDPKDKVTQTLQTVGQLTNKLRSRTNRPYHAVVNHMTNLKQQSEASIASLGHVLEMIPSSVRAETEVLSAKVNALWTELSTEEKEGEEGGTTDEQRAVIVARKLVRRVALFCSQVPTRLTTLMPTALAQQMEQAATYASGLYDSIMVCEKSGLRDISESVQSNMKDQATKVQAILHEFNLYTMQMVDAFSTRNKELTESTTEVKTPDVAEKKSN